MIVSAVRINILILDSTNLKAKRGVVNSLKKRIANKFNVSIAEVDGYDRYNYVELGLSAVGRDGKIVENILDSVVKFIHNDLRVEILEVVRVV